jgi:hypothetical protein
MNLALGCDGTTPAIIAFPSPDPRVYLAPAVMTVTHWSEATARMKAGHPIEAVALTEAPLPGLPAAPPPGFAGQAGIITFSLNRITIRSHSNRPALLVVKEAWYPGWQATVNGIARPVIPVNAWMRGVPVPAGDCETVLTFFPEYFMPGLLISGLAFALALWWWSRPCSRS